MTLINLGETPGDGTGDSRRYAGQKINALLPLIVKSVSVTTPPSSPQENDRYIIPANAAGDWANRENKIAAWQPVVWENDAWNHDGGWLYVTPEEGLPASDVNGSVLYKFLGGTWVVYDPQDAVTAAEAARDAAIAASENLAWGYTFDSGVTDSDPGTGKFRFDNATFMSATFLYISQTADEGDISSVIDSWDDSTSSSKATIKVRDPISPSNWLEAAVTGNSIDAGNYWKIPIAPVATSGSIANSLSVLLGAVRHGDAGSGSVDSFNGRTGLIEPAGNDYDSDKIGNTSDVIGSTVTEALNSLNSGLSNAVMASGDQVFGDGGAQVRSNIGAEVNLGELHLQHQKPSGIGGGTRYGSTSVWALYPFNTVITNTIAGASMLNSVITLPVGTYKVLETRVRGVNMLEARLKITHNTSAGSALVGETAYANGSNGSSVALLSGEFTVTSAGELQIDYRPKGTTGGTNDLGRPASSGDVEIYGNCVIRKVA